MRRLVTTMSDLEFAERSNDGSISVSNLNLAEILDLIDEYLRYSDVSGGLWDVLSALRGPDSQDIELKTSTTIYIRGAAFPLSAQADRKESKMFPAQIVHGVKDHHLVSIRDFVKTDSDHFSTHIRYAVLNLRTVLQVRSQDVNIGPIE